MIKAFFEWLKKTINELLGVETKTPTPTKSATVKSTAVKKEPFVYITLKGKKFHYDVLCPGLRNSKEIKMELSKARKAGYTACDKCCYSYLHE